MLKRLTAQVAAKSGVRVLFVVEVGVGVAVGKDVSVRCHVLVVGDSCLPAKFGFIFSTHYLLDREERSGGFGGAALPHLNSCLPTKFGFYSPHNTYLTKKEMLGV